MKFTACSLSLAVASLAVGFDGVTKTMAADPSNLRVGEKHASEASQQFGSDEILLEDFSNAIHTWKELNDPVMGGKSTGTFSIEDGVGKFIGQVVDVPFLQAPGFIQARTVDRGNFPDVSSCAGFLIKLKASGPDYAGYRFSFGNARPPNGKMFALGYKTDVKLASSDEFTEIFLPFGDFSDYWDDATGDAIVTCKEDSTYCPTKRALEDLKSMTIWGEGVGGDVNLELKTIKAVKCASAN